MRATLVNLPPSGLVNNIDEQLIAVSPFIGKTGLVIEVDDDAYHADHPTGYYLIDFGVQVMDSKFNFFSL